MIGENVYCGKKSARVAGAGKVWRNGKPFSPDASLKVVRHSPEGFQWGYGGSGPAQLALALLLDVLRSTPRAVAWHQLFKRQVVCRMFNEWVLTANDVLEWYIRADAEKSTETVVHDEA